MMDVGRHPKIELLAYSEVEDIAGYIGNFHVTVRRKARYVNSDVCTSCGECAKVCPVVTSDEHQQGFATRKAVYIPFAQAVPASYVINMADCLGNNPIACGKCGEICDAGAIDYDQKDEMITFDVGAVIVATGMDVYDPTCLDEYRYKRSENVLTSLEFEILTGPGYVTGSELLRPTDRKRPRSIAFIQCVGSRSEHRGNPYCSNICCMNAVKNTLYLKDHYPEMECVVFYMDMRTFGKGYEDLYKRSKGLGVKYIRGIPGDIVEDPETKNLMVTVENTTTGKIEHREFEMVVLSTGVIPRADTEAIRNKLTLSKTPDGFLMESHYQLSPLDAPTSGVFLAGCCESPKDIKSSVIQASGAAARAIRLLSSGTVSTEPIISSVDPDLCKSCGICADACPYGLITVDRQSKTPAVITDVACKGCGACGASCTFDAITMQHFTDRQIMAMIDAMLEEHPQDKICIFACNWCSYAGADLAGISRMQYPANGRIIRTMCSARVDEKFIWRAFEKGAPIVLVSGCHFADCHYINANRSTQRRVESMWNKLEKKGIRPERLQLEWVSAAEASRWRDVMLAVEELRKRVTLEEIGETRKILSQGKPA
jgi:heterodisulfide reductase subunit A